MESLTTRFDKEVFLPYLELLKAQYRIHPTFKHAKQTWEEKLSPQELVKGPYLEKAQNYKLGATLESLSLHPKTIETLNQCLGKRGLWKHQTDALDLILEGKNVIIATGTSSGKTLCYQIPILDDLLRNPSPGLRAIIIYPLNALVNDQLREWEKMLRGHPHINFARFTGQTPKNQIEYVGRERECLHETLRDKGLSDQQLQQEIERLLREQLRLDPPNRLNHREAIRANPPQVLVTNFSMLEYLLERPVDAPIFENARLKFLVLDEAHAYRGVQSTEIAFLIRRVKDRLGLDRLTCIATSATLGKKDDPQSRYKVRQFAANIFDEEFVESNPIYGETTEPSLEQPSFKPSPQQYLQVAERLRDNPQADVRALWGAQSLHKSLVELLAHDENLYLLRNILIKAMRLDEAAKAIWPQDSQTKEGLQALLEIVAFAKKDGAHEDLLPTRLHYFVRAQDGLHVCLHKDCSDRRDGKAAYFVSRKSEPDIPEGDCPACYRVNRTSKLVEVVSCRKCGYLYGAMQDLGPRRAQTPDIDPDGKKPEFDSFTTELGWASDSYWSYFSVEDDLPYPAQPKVEEDDDDQEDLFANPTPLNWCVICGKKNEEGAGDNCTCGQPHVRTIKVFHRQCPYTGKARDRENLYKQEKTPLTSCPNCGARNSSGLEPVRRFQESDDEIGMAMAIPLAHFQVTPQKVAGRIPRKLLCFTDNRQRAAAFPSLLEEETFSYDLGRKVTEIVREVAEPLTFVDLAHRLVEFANKDSKVYDPDFFLPVSRWTGEDPDPREKRNLWIAETFAYFGIPDAARESAEDFGLVAVEYHVNEEDKALFSSLLNAPHLNLFEANAALQVLLGYLRQAKAFTLPRGVEPNAPAFGRVVAPISYVLRKEGIRSTKGWLPHLNQDGTYRHNFITSYLRRLLSLPQSSILAVAENIWEFLTSHYLLHQDIRGSWKLDYERLYVVKPSGRHVCTKCGIVTVYSAGQVCPRKECEGTMVARTFDPAQENIIARWVSGAIVPRFSTLNSEEHTAQIEKDLAGKIEVAFRAAEGVNLLSSTTTFEMGINFPDLQKVLLRNAPPASANYVQRVGRVGRGEDKNAICVTLCRRTKYDADAWNDPPPRLMSGEVRTPTVFINNRIIAQRHFNATVFAQFLRVKIVEERVLGGIEQSIPLECFLAPDSRENIPPRWFKVPQAVLCGFEDWLSQQSEANIFRTEKARSALKAFEGFQNAKAFATEKYEEIFVGIADELKALVVERDKLVLAGNRIDEIDRAIKDLLGRDVIAVLAKRGFLPRYAFPLDLVTLETGWTRWSRDVDVELSRDRALAIAEFAPGAQVIAHKKVFTSAGLYVVSETDKPVRQWYFKCKDCEQIRTALTPDELKGVCAVCQKPVNQSQDLKPFVAPVAFSVRIDKDNQGATRHRRTSLVRQRQTITHFIDFVEPDLLRDFGLFQVALKEKGHLFRYNLGPGNKGFMLCDKCGCSAPLSSVRPGQKHKRLRAFSGNMQCENTLTWGKPATPLAYGHVFETFCLIARPQAPIAYVESLAYSLQKGLCAVLEIEAMDIGVSWRWLAKRTEGAGVEIILYDRTPGGAGFAEEGRDNWKEVVRKAYEICSTCRCETACYDCLKDYGNQTYHEKLDRNRVAEFLGG